MPAWKLRHVVWIGAICVAACEVDNPNYKPLQGDMTMSVDMTASVDLAAQPDMAVSPADACGAMAAAVCDRLNTCNPFGFKTDFADPAGCIARKQINCVGRFSLNGATLKPAELMACAQEITKTLSCNDYLMGNVPISCRFKGTLIAASKCGDNAQCSSGYCLKPDAASCGSCSERLGEQGACKCTVRSGALDDCTDTACTYGLYCPPTGIPGAGKCAQPVKSDSTCSAGTLPCLPTLTCASGNSFVCANPIVAPNACVAADGACDGLHGQFCFGSKCAASQTANPNEACTLGATQCLAGSACNSTKCIPPAENGAPCNPANSVGCKVPAICSGNICKVLDPATCI